MSPIFFYKIFISFFLVFILSWLYLFMPQAFFSIDNRLRDYMFLMRGEIPKTNTQLHNDVVIVDIDENSLSKYGQWPWNRKLIAQMLYNLNDAGTGIIGLDIVFAEADKQSPHLLKSKYPEITQPLENYDQILANAFAELPVIGGYVFKFEAKSENQSDKEPISMAIFQETHRENSTILEAKDVVLNIETFNDTFYSSGFFNNISDEEGVIRHVPLILRYQDVLYPSLALEMLRIYSGATTIYIDNDTAGVENLSFGNFHIPIDKVGRMFINFRGKKGYFHYISAADILENTFDPSEVKNKFILIGTSALGLMDLRSSVYDFALPGVEVHANVIDNILHKDFLYRPAEIVLYDILIIFGVVLFTMVALCFIRSWSVVVFVIAMIYMLYEFFYYLLFEYGYVLNILFPFMAYIFSLIFSLSLDYIFSSQQKEEAKRMLGKKVSPAVMEYLLKHSHEDIIASKEIEATIFFSDIRSFTTISEKIGSPDKVIEMLNRYMTPMVQNIISHHGTIDKFIGDAIMAYWNAPIAVKNHADEALKSAIEQINMLEEINKEIQPLFNISIDIGIGIHTGLVTAGDMGAQGRSDYTIIGDNVNLASRMEGLTKLYGAKILISHATYKSLKGQYTIRPIDLVEVKGKSEAVEIYEVLCGSRQATEREMKLYLKATKFFRAGELEEAYRLYTLLQHNHPSKLYTFYIERCLEFLSHKKEFTPILVMHTK